MSQPEHQRSERERVAAAIADRMDGPVTVLGVIFVLLVVAETAASGDGDVQWWFNVAAWALWAVFAFEFVLRMVIAPSTGEFIRRNWWQAVFLVLPFLRFLRIAGRLSRLRPARLGRVASAAVRGVRTAARTLTGRIAWLVAVTAVVVLTASQLLFEFSGYPRYGDALHDAAYAAITGERLTADGAVADAVGLVLALYAVVVFAFLAGSLGAFLLERDRSRGAAQEAAPAEQVLGAPAP